MSIVPLALYAVAFVGYALHFARRTALSARFATTALAAATLAQETGGRPFFPAKVEDLNGVYAQIADELASQYTLGYSSKNVRRDGAYRRIVVQVARPGVSPRSKRGYYAPTSR